MAGGYRKLDAGFFCFNFRQQHGLKMVLAYVANVLVKMNIRTKCMLFFICQDLFSVYT